MYFFFILWQQGFLIYYLCMSSLCLSSMSELFYKKAKHKDNMVNFGHDALCWWNHLAKMRIGISDRNYDEEKLKRSMTQNFSTIFSWRNQCLAHNFWSRQFAFVVKSVWTSNSQKCHSSTSESSKKYEYRGSSFYILQC